jgi:hypothetical protein
MAGAMAITVVNSVAKSELPAQASPDTSLCSPVTWYGDSIPTTSILQVTINRAANTLAATTMKRRIPAVRFHRANDNISLRFQRTKRQQTNAGCLTSHRRHNSGD